MIKREFKINLKSAIIWSSILIIMFFVVYLIYPYFITYDSMRDLDDMMKTFPPELLKAFNMDMSSISTAYGWYKTEGFMFVLLIFGFYSAHLGGTILLKEESDKTIEYLASLPIKRSRIVTDKIFVGSLYIILMVFLFGVFNFIALSILGDFDHKQFLLLSIVPLLISLPFFSINLFISTFMHKTKKNVGISLGMVFIFYLLNVLSELTTKVEFLKYFSIYTLADVRKVISNVSINPIMIVISFMITILMILFSYIVYRKKELI